MQGSKARETENKSKEQEEQTLKHGTGQKKRREERNNDKNNNNNNTIHMKRKSKNTKHMRLDTF